MISLSFLQLSILVVLIFFAGFVDSVAGGGGLISLASYSYFGLPPVIALGNNKFGPTFGTAFAMYSYIKAGLVIWKSALFSALFALLGSLIGASLALHYSDYYFRYMMLILLPVIGFFILRKKELYKGKRRSGKAEIIIASLIGALIGTYDGFFGPGTGMFLTLAFSALLGYDTLNSCANTKVINFSSNVAALVTFILNGTIIYSIGIPCAIASILGNSAGAHYAIKGGGKAVRPMVLFVLLLLMINIISSFF